MKEFGVEGSTVLSDNAFIEYQSTRKHLDTSRRFLNFLYDIRNEVIVNLYEDKIMWWKMEIILMGNYMNMNC